MSKLVSFILCIVPLVFSSFFISFVTFVTCCVFLISLLLLSLVLIGCSSTRYKLAYEALDYLSIDYLSKSLLIEEAYYTNNKEVMNDPHVVINYSFINMYNQRTNRYFLYINEEVNEDSKNSDRFFDLVVTTSYYHELDVDKLNEYINKKN